MIRIWQTNDLGIFTDQSFRNKSSALNNDLQSVVCDIRSAMKEINSFGNIQNEGVSSESDESSEGDTKGSKVVCRNGASEINLLPRGIQIQHEGPASIEKVTDSRSEPLSQLSSSDDISEAEAETELMAKYANLGKSGCGSWDGDRGSDKTVPASDLLAMLQVVKSKADHLAVSYSPPSSCSASLNGHFHSPDSC